MLLKIHLETPEQRKIDKAVKILKEEGVIIYPTDTVYAYGCDLNSSTAIDKIVKLKRLDPMKARLTFICNDISQLSQYCAQINNETFKLIKSHTPGPYTFILNGNNKLPRKFKNRRKTVGARIPDHNISQALVKTLGNPMMSISLTAGGSDEYPINTDKIQETLGHSVDLIIDGGFGNVVQPSTVIDCTGDTPVLIREGKGEVGEIIID